MDSLPSTPSLFLGAAAAAVLARRGYRHLCASSSGAAPSSAQFGDDEIFYGSVPVHFRRVAGRAVRYDEATYAPDAEVDAVTGHPNRTLKRKDPIPHADGGAPVVVPCMPCLDVLGGDAEGDDDVSSWPEFLRSPLIKCAEAVAGEPKAFASGCRSACVKLEGKWYRLKGSGNNDQVRRKCRAETGQRPGSTGQYRALPGITNLFARPLRCKAYGFLAPS